MAAGDRFVGTVEGKYPERAAAAHGHDPRTTLVRGSMVTKMYYCLEDQSLEEARDLMRRHHLLHLPVVDKNLRIIGVVALNDVEDESVQGDVFILTGRLSTALLDGRARRGVEQRLAFLTGWPVLTAILAG